jgi:CspA family cold shock protein|tara:strand:+ start:148 stop:372 length:225 start_codon:yes stop_codon:yes gene_type:complete
MTQQGKLKWYNHVKGYGFIGREEGQSDLFVHISEFRKIGIKKVIDGMHIEYDLDDHNGKPIAINLKLIHTPEPK